MQVYKQTTNYTCSASSLLTILNHFGKMELNRKNEYKIWLASALLPIRASSIYALAIISKRAGLNPKVVVGEHEFSFPDYRFKGYTKNDIELATFTSNLYYKRAKRMKINIEEREFDIREVKKLLKNNILLLRVDLGVIRQCKPVVSYIVVYGYKDGNFLVNDPSMGKIKVSEEDLNASLEALSEKRKRDNRMLIFSK